MTNLDALLLETNKRVLASYSDELFTTQGGTMLVLMRKVGETIYIGDNIRLTVVDIDQGRMRLGIEAPQKDIILRGELLTLDQRNNFHVTATNPPAARPTPTPIPREAISDPTPTQDRRDGNDEEWDDIIFSD